MCLFCYRDLPQESNNIFCKSGVKGFDQTDVTLPSFVFIDSSC